jgi:hypothetical protein
MRVPILIAALALAVPVAAQDTRAPTPAAGQTGSPPTAGGPMGQPAATMVIEPVAMMIAACDADNDGKTTHAELTQCIGRSFAAVDTAHKGSIGYIDYSDWALKWLGDRNALPSPFTVDADGDNRITLAELQAQFDTLFARFDVNKDGAVTRAELLTIKSRAVGGLDEPDRKRKRR